MIAATGAGLSTLAVLAGVLLNDQRLSDHEKRFDRRINDLEKRVDRQFSEHRELLRSEMRRFEEHPG